MAYERKRLGGWGAPSYDPITGRSASSVMDTGEAGWTHARGDAQIATTHVKGQGGAPGADAMSKSGSGDPGRRKWARPVG